jgi:hypothetical protein
MNTVGAKLERLRAMQSAGFSLQTITNPLNAEASRCSTAKVRGR